MSECERYILMPIEESANDHAWDVKILSGNFDDTVIRFGNIAANEENGYLTFNFDVISSPLLSDEELTPENEGLQEVAGMILSDLLEDAVENNTLVTRNKVDKSNWK